MTMRKQAGQTKKNTTTAAHKTTRRSAGTKTAAKSTPSKKASANTGLILLKLSRNLGYPM